MSEAVLRKLEELGEFRLGASNHDSFDEGFCAMELVSWLNDEPWSDAPECTCPVLTAFVVAWNDSLPDDERTTILAPFLPKLIGTRNKALEEKRSLMAADWLVRTHIVAWLRVAGLSAQADSLANLPEITSMAMVPSLRGPIEVVTRDAEAAWAAAWDAAGDAARAAARDAAWAAARAAARDAAWDAAWAAARAEFNSLVYECFEDLL